MTVREFIEYLKTLDQDRKIWLVYDRYEIKPLKADVLGDDVDFVVDDVDENGDTVQKGDYVFDAY